MKILILNGSPRSGKSNTMYITKAFVSGVKRDGDTVDLIDVEKSNMRGCKGCFTCWGTDKCVIHDEFSESFFSRYVEADLVIWSFPLYFYSLPGKLKEFMDRTFLNDLSAMLEGEDGLPIHPSRYDVSSQRHIVISNCGFYSAEHIYDAVLAQFRLCFGKRFCEAICCAQGECMKSASAASVTQLYLAAARDAGMEFRDNGAITEKTREQLKQPFFPAQVYMDMANTRVY